MVGEEHDLIKTTHSSKDIVDIRRKSWDLLCKVFDGYAQMMILRVKSPWEVFVVILFCLGVSGLFWSLL